MKKLIDFIKREYKYLLFILLFMIMNFLFLCNLHISKFSSSHLFIFVALIFLNIIFIGGYAFLFRKKEDLKVEKLYLMMIIPLGLFYLFLFPVNQMPDENTHLMRISEISLGHLSSKMESKKGIQGRYMDANLSKVIGANRYKEVIKRSKIKSSKDLSFYHFANTALYSFVCYLPQTMGMLIAKTMNLPIIFQVYMARLFNFLVFILLTYQALKLIPIKKSCFFLILFFPIVLQEAVSLSPDALTIAASMFFIAYVFHLRYKEESLITKKEIGVLALTSIVLSLCKIVYLPICFLIFFIPRQKFSSRKRKNIMVLWIVLISILINLIWLSISKNFLPKTNGINSGSQLHYILTDFLSYGMTAFRTYDITGKDLLFHSFGNSLGNLNIRISELYIIPIMLLFLIFVLYDNDQNKRIIIKNSEKVWIIFLILGVVALISTSLYLQWTPVGSSTIAGIQGRYFIPIYFLLPFLFTKYKLLPRKEFLNRYVYLYLVALNTYVFSTIFYQFI
ncbi:MAG: DUF2142 domain-containing protein [Bacilli bacterium]|nr:DUF2142 domain-containing protein [Bacilli bacterium]